MSQPQPIQTCRSRSGGRQASCILRMVMPTQEGELWLLQAILHDPSHLLLLPPSCHFHGPATATQPAVLLEHAESTTCLPTCCCRTAIL